MNHHGDGRWIAPSLLSHLLDAAEYLGHGWNGKEDGIPPVRQFCQTFECCRHESAHVNRRMRLLHGLGINVRLGQIEELSAELNWICGPDSFQQWQKFIRHCPSFRYV